MRDTSTHEATAIQAIFDRLASRGLVPEAQGLVGTFQLDIADAGRWYVTVDQERLMVSQEAVEADCAIGCSADDFVLMTEGKLNLLTAFLQGRIRGGGNPTLAVGFDRLLPVRQ